MIRNINWQSKDNDYLVSIKKNHCEKVQKWIDKRIKAYLIDNGNACKITSVNDNDPDWLKKKIENGEEVYTLKTPTKSQTKQFNEWLDFLESYKGNINAITPLQLPDMIKKVKQAKKKIADKYNNFDEGTKVVYQYEDGYYWVQLLTSESCIKEGMEMGNCLGNSGESHIKDIPNGKEIAFSLRSPNHTPHCDLSFYKGCKYISDIKGANNQVLEDKYMPYLTDFLNNKRAGVNIQVEDYACSSFGLKYDNGKYMAIAA